MKRHLIRVIIPFLLAGCSGLQIDTLKYSEVKAARADKGKPLDGYVIYEPMTVVELSLKESCSKALDKDGKCTGTTIKQCSASIAFQLPDYSKPYLLKNKNGFGKAGVDVTITDGWKLGGFKDNTDNTAILGVLEKVITKDFNAASASDCKAGLYKLSPKVDSNEEVTLNLEPFKLYN